MTINPQLDLAAVTARYQKLLERIPCLAWLMTDQGDVVSANQQCYQYFGRANSNESAESITPDHPWTFIEILHDEDYDRFWCSWTAAQKSQQRLAIELQLCSAGGDWEWFKVELEPDCDAWGETIWIGTAMRLSEGVACLEGRKSTQFLPATIALQQSEQKFRAIFDSVFQFIGLIEPDGTLIEANLTALRFGGMKAEEAIGYRLWEVPGWKFSPAAQQQLRDSIARAAQGEFIRYEVEVQGAANQLVPLDFSLMPIRNDRGEIVLIIPEGRDISQLKQAEVERTCAERHSERLSIALQVAKAGAWHWDFINQKIFWTREFEILFDYEPGTTQQVYSEWFARLHPDDRERAETALKGTIDRTLSEYRCEYRIVYRDGQIRWIDAIGELNTDEHGHPRLSGLVYDITDRKQLEILNQTQTADLQRLNNSLMLIQQRLKEQNEKLDSFVYVASHDLKAPLRSIANLSEWIEDDLNGHISEDNQKQFQLLRQRVQRMNALIDGLLRYSRIGRQELTIETVDVAQLLSETIDSLDPPASFKIEILSPLPTLDTKRILLGQIFANLLSNAIKHHDRATGQIEITAKDLGDRYQFSIRDDGPGIPVGESRERIFEIFQTLQPSVSSENTGIGLALIKKIIEGEGGQVWLEENSKEGACFCFTWLKTFKY